MSGARPQSAGGHEPAVHVKIPAAPELPAPRPCSGAGPPRRPETPGHQQTPLHQRSRRPGGSRFRPRCVRSSRATVACGDPRRHEAPAPLVAAGGAAPIESPVQVAARCPEVVPADGGSQSPTIRAPALQEGLVETFDDVGGRSAGDGIASRTRRDRTCRPLEGPPTPTVEPNRSRRSRKPYDRAPGDRLPRRRPVASSGRLPAELQG